MIIRGEERRRSLAECRGQKCREQSSWLGPCEGQNVKEDLVGEGGVREVLGKGERDRCGAGTKEDESSSRIES